MIALVNLLIVLLIAGLVFYIIYWFVGQVPLQPPFKAVVLGVLALIVVIFLLGLLFGYTPMPRFIG